MLISAPSRRISVFPLGLSMFPLGLSVFPLGLSVFPLGLSVFPLGLSVFPPLGLSVFPLGLSVFPPLGLSVFPLGLSRAHPSDERVSLQQAHQTDTPPFHHAVHIRVTKEADFIKRTRHPPSTTVVLELQTHLTLNRGLLFGPEYACTVLRSSAGTKGRGYRLYLHRVDEPLLRLWNTSNVIVQRVQMSQPFRAYSQACPKEIPEVGTDIICPLIHVYRSYGVQIVKGYTFGRVDIMRTMHSRIDSMRMTGVSDFKRGNGVIRVMLSGYGPLLVRAYIYITNNEVYGAYMPVLLHVGAVGVVVRNNYVHDFVFAGITCGNMVHSQGSCMPSTIANNLIVAAGQNFFNPLTPPRPHLPLSPRSSPQLSRETACSAPYLRPWRLHAQHHLQQPCCDKGRNLFNRLIPPPHLSGPFPSFVPPTSQGDCMLSTISNNLVVAAGRNLTGGWDATGIYFVTHWINPGNLAECNYIIGGDHCYYLDYASSGVTIRGGACIGTVDGMKVNNGKWNRIEHVVMKGTEGTPGWNRIEHVVMKGTEGTPGWCACITATICNCLKDPGNYWDRMRAKYYGTAVFQQDPGNYWDRMRSKYYSSAVFQQVGLVPLISQLIRSSRAVCFFLKDPANYWDRM
ncbi:unnamed protein product [Closterium sp. NIES-65]|nr:unnamed protein product [Closterium sp. NIES-65]